MVWPTRPLSQPGMTWDGCAAMRAPNGWRRCQEESNIFFVRQISPTYWVITYWPLVIAGPVPRTRVRTIRDFGGEPFGSVTDGALPCALPTVGSAPPPRSEEHTSELQSRPHLVCRLLLEKK